MSKLTMLMLAVTMLSIPLPTRAEAANSRNQDGKVEVSCTINVDGQLGKDNQGHNVGRGGKAGTIDLKGKLPAGCVSANGGNGGNNNRGSSTGNGGTGGTIKF